MQLAEVGHARVGGEAGLEVDHLLERSLGGVVAPQLDLGVDEHGEGRERAGRHTSGGLAVGQGSAEVVASERKGAHSDASVEIARVAL